MKHYTRDDVASFGFDQYWVNLTDVECLKEKLNKLSGNDHKHTEKLVTQRRALKELTKSYEKALARIDELEDYIIQGEGFYPEILGDSITKHPNFTRRIQWQGVQKFRRWLIKDKKDIGLATSPFFEQFKRRLGIKDD